MGNYNMIGTLCQARPNQTIEIPRSALTEAEERTIDMLGNGYHPGNEAIELLDTVAALRDQVRVLVNEREILIQERQAAQEAAKKAEIHLATAMAVIADYQATIAALAARKHRDKFPFFPCDAGKE